MRVHLRQIVQYNLAMMDPAAEKDFHLALAAQGIQLHKFGVQTLMEQLQALTLQTNQLLSRPDSSTLALPVLAVLVSLPVPEDPFIPCSQPKVPFLTEDWIVVGVSGVPNVESMPNICFYGETEKQTDVR